MKQLWACSQCKLKQDAILKSNQWLNNNTNNSLAKCYVSDYLINNKSKINSNSKRYSSLIDNSNNNNNNNNDYDDSIKNSNIINTQRSFDNAGMFGLFLLVVLLS